jgi:acyl dehydratase
MVGDTLWWRAKVTAKELVDGVCVVHLEVEAKNQQHVLSASGTAAVALPSRAHGSIRLPLCATAQSLGSGSTPP